MSEESPSSDNHRERLERGLDYAAEEFFDNDGQPGQTFGIGIAGKVIGEVIELEPEPYDEIKTIIDEEELLADRKDPYWQAFIQGSKAKSQRLREQGRVR